MASMKAKLGQQPGQQKQFVPGAPAQNRVPTQDAPKAPTK